MRKGHQVGESFGGVGRFEAVRKPGLGRIRFVDAQKDLCNRERFSDGDQSFRCVPRFWRGPWLRGVGWGRFGRVGFRLRNTGRPICGGWPFDAVGVVEQGEPFGRFFRLAKFCQAVIVEEFKRAPPGRSAG